MDLVEWQRADPERHPWERVRAEFFEPLVEAALRTRVACRVLDAGAGDAWFARRVAARFGDATVIAWDPGYAETGAEAYGPAPANLVSARERPAGPFDLVLLLDVLEHVEDDAQLLRELAAEVAPGGTLIVSVPAWPALFTSHDASLRHVRRYRPAQAAALLRGAGLEIAASGGLFHSLLAPRAAQALAERLVPRRDASAGIGRWHAPRIVTATVTAALRIDAALARAEARLGLTVPGLSWWATCTKPRS